MRPITTMRHYSLIACAIVAVAIAPPGVADEGAKKIDVAPQQLSSALQDFSEQSGLQVAYVATLADNVDSKGTHDAGTAEAALSELLDSTGLEYQFVNADTVAIGPVLAANNQAEDLGNAQTTSGRMVLMAQASGMRQVDPSSSASRVNPSSQSEDKNLPIEEIIVTAQKRGDERLQDVPVPISVLSATSLLENGATSLQDYFSKVPGVSLTSAVGGVSTVIIRGVSTNGVSDNPTVGVTVDDAPYGASTFLGGGLQPIDLDPNDLTRIEVLRGPQGTLYGASSLGGLLRYVMVEPSLDEMSGRVMVSGQSPRNNDGLDYALRGSINLPINSSLALRVSGFNREEAGYIDDTFSGKDGINSGHSYGGRAALLWRANEDWSVKLSAVRQLLRWDSANVVDRDPAEEEPLESSNYMPNSTGSDRSVTFLTGLIEGRVADIDLTSITGYTRSTAILREPFTRGFFALPFLLQPGADASRFLDNLGVSKFSQEFRASIAIRDNIDWLVGAFYTEEEGDFVEGISSALRTTGELLAESDIFYTDSTLYYTEMAAFTNLNVRFTDRFDVQFGGRLIENRQRFVDERGGFLLGGVPLFRTERTTDEAFTYLVTPRFKLTDDWMVYSRIASGYRPGGPSFNAALPGAPDSLIADTTENYEVGLKGDLFERRLSIDVSAYYIDWKDIPVGVRDPGTGLGFFVNAAGAISKGLELSLNLRPLQGLTLSAWGAWGDAYISDLPANENQPFDEGDRLPYSPRFSGNASIDYERPLFGTMSGNVGASVRYVGDRVYSIGQPDNVLTAYTQVDVHVGVTSESWTVNAFINNLTDERGRIGVPPFTNPPAFVNIIRPRTIGLSISKDF